MYTPLKPRSVVSGLGRKGAYLFRKPRAGGLPGDGPLVHFTKGRQTSNAGFLVQFPVVELGSHILKNQNVETIL